MKCAEFFSGIGGMHYALKKAADAASVEAHVVAAFDINQIANAVYTHNLGIRPATTLVEHLPIAYYEALGADMWLLSPPCQPFTRGGKMQDHEDARSAGLLHLINVLGRMQSPPSLVVLENVSECHRLLIEQLEKRGYSIDEYLVTPCDPWIDIPNNRLRYYLAARRLQPGHLPHHGRIFRTFSEALDGRSPVLLKPPRSLESFLRPPKDPTPFIVPSCYLTDYKNYRHDVAKPCDFSCTTFTKAYGSKYIIGTGSFLQTAAFDLEYAKDDPEALLKAGLRFFTPTEVALLHAFPVGDGFGFPEGLSLVQQYRLLGNSLNVAVVALILQRLFAASVDTPCLVL